MVLCCFNSEKAEIADSIYLSGLVIDALSDYSKIFSRLPDRLYPLICLPASKAQLPSVATSTFVKQLQQSSIGEAFLEAVNPYVRTKLLNVYNCFFFF